MPLEHSASPAAFKRNVSTLMHEVGKSPHVQSRSQALAIAYATKRRGRQAGGQTPWFVRQEAKNLGHVGPIMSAVPGRTDKHAMNVPAGSYVMNASSVSHLGQNNTMAGMQVLNQMFHSGPYGGSMPSMKAHGSLPKPPKIAGIGRADGGNTALRLASNNPTPLQSGLGSPPLRLVSDSGGARGDVPDGTVPIMAAGGEFVIHPEAIIRKYGSLDFGHKVLDEWQKQLQKDHAKTIKALPPPAKS